MHLVGFIIRIRIQRRDCSVDFIASREYFQATKKIITLNSSLQAKRESSLGDETYFFFFFAVTLSPVEVTRFFFGGGALQCEKCTLTQNTSISISAALCA